MFAPPAKVRRRNNPATPKADAPTRVAQRAGAGIGNQAALRRLANGGAGVAPPIVRDVVRGAGKPLTPAPRAFFEAKLGADLGAVRLHDDARAARSAKAIGALAYAAGSHVVFDAGRLAPSRPEGIALLAHELAHVVQARGTGEAAVVRRQTPDDDPKKDPKPLVRWGDYVPSIAPYVPFPGASGPSPYDAPSKITDPPGKGPSSEDLNKGLHSIFDAKEPKLGLNNNAKLSDCSKLELSGSTAAARKYWTFEQYDLQRKMSHSRLSDDPWPPMTRDEYNAAIASCPKGYGPVNDEPAHPAAPRPDPAPDMPPLLPPGQAYA
jgi:hypothetical protein